MEASMQIRFPHVARLAAMFGALLAGSPALAGDFTLGVGGGVSDVRGEASTAIAFQPGQRLDDSDAAYEIFANYRFHRYFSAEVGYQDLGRVSKRFAIDPAIIFLIPPNSVLEAEIRTLSVGLVFDYPLGERVSVFAMGGIARHDIDTLWTDELKAPALGEPDVARNGHDTAGWFGVGARFSFDDDIALRLSWRTGKASTGGAESRFDARYAGLALEYGF
jgi:opacity protein-like surface antigen